MNKSIPESGEMPAKTPNEAPEKPISDNVCVKNEVWRATTKTPMTPQISAMKIPAIKA